MSVFKEVNYPYVLGRSMDHLENAHEIEIKQSFWIRGSIKLRVFDNFLARLTWHF